MHVIKASRGSGVMASVILNLSIRWRWVVSLTPPLLYYQGENPLYVSKMRLGVPQSQFGHFGEEKNIFFFPPTRIWTPDHPIHSPVTESLYWICCPSSNNSGKFYELCFLSCGILQMCFVLLSFDRSWIYKCCCVNVNVKFSVKL
jgi:hypothetical protein